MQLPALFFMDLSGNRELLDRPMVAFFASRTAPEGALALATRWAERVAQTEQVVISGFHAPIERAVLDVLLKHRHPVIVALGRSLYRKCPPLFQTPLAEGRLLFISFRASPRTSFSTAQQRNWAAADLADELVFAPFAPSSQLSTLHYTYDHSKKPCRIL